MFALRREVSACVRVLLSLGILNMFEIIKRILKSCYFNCRLFLVTTYFVGMRHPFLKTVFFRIVEPKDLIKASFTTLFL